MANLNCLEYRQFETSGLYYTWRLYLLSQNRCTLGLIEHRNSGVFKGWQQLRKRLTNLRHVWHVPAVPGSNIGRGSCNPDRDFIANSLRIPAKYLNRGHEPLLSSPYPFNFQNHLLIRRYTEIKSLNTVRINESSLSLTQWWNGGTAPPFLTAALDGVKRSASRTGRFIPGERAYGIHRTGDWLIPKSVWMLWGRKKSLSLAGIEP
jgi:hypothetical protein